MKLVNLTPHRLTLCNENGMSKVIAPSGIIPRCEEIRKTLETLKFDYLSVEIVQKSFGEVMDMPEPEEGTYYVVSAIVANALTDRDDVFCPGDLVRDSEGTIIGCKCLCKIRA